VGLHQLLRYRSQSRPHHSFIARLSKQEIFMKHTRTILASSIVAAFVGASGLTFAQPTENLHANATVESRIDMATGPAALAPAAPYSYATEQHATAQSRVEAETGAFPVAAYVSDSYSVAVAPQAAAPVATDAAPAASDAAPSAIEIANAQTDGTTEPQMASLTADEQRTLDQFWAEYEADMTAPEPEVALVEADNSFMTAYASPEVAKPQDEIDTSVTEPEPEAAASDTPDRPLRTDTAAPTSNSVPVTGDYDRPASTPDSVEAPATTTDGADTNVISLVDDEQ